MHAPRSRRREWRDTALRARTDSSKNPPAMQARRRRGLRLEYSPEAHAPIGGRNGSIEENEIMAAHDFRAVFAAKATLAAMRGDKTMAELSETFKNQSQDT